MSELFRTATFRTAAIAALAFGATTLLLFGFVYWQATILESQRIDRFLVGESEAIARQDSASMARDVATRFARDLHRQAFAAIFTQQFAKIEGDIDFYPPDLMPDGVPHKVTAVREGVQGAVRDRARAVARIVTGGRILLVGRSDDPIPLRALLVHALALGLLPAMLSALAIGALASRRTLVRLRGVNHSMSRIMQGKLGERLDNRESNDAFDQLARGVNRMLDEIERLVAEIQGVGDDIAHDLRTPLSRMRARLEGARTRATSRDELAAAIDQAIADLDQAFSLITALLRIGQIDGSARRAGFAAVSLTAIAREAFELYEPVAELRDITLSLDATPDLMVQGDRDLLFEVAANLLDNAIKFTLPGGSVVLGAHPAERGHVLRVADTGPGIPPDERATMLQRFHRADRSRHVPGYGLGLSLVAAILRLHVFHLHMEDGSPGLVVEVRTWQA